jgi:2-amino-4-hydroxy-6-hydroxymethyldihydropteridine diphosphokinase
MNKVYLLMGGNEGNLIITFGRAAQLLESRCGNILARSSIYRTAAWGKTDQPEFLNQALLMDTALDPSMLMQSILQIEEDLGRKRGEKYGPRTIDIDILFFNETSVDLPQLTIPHPQLQNRRFALEPMNEIAPAWIHPLLHKTIHELLIACPDHLDVQKL